MFIVISYTNQWDFVVKILCHYFGKSERQTACFQK